MNYKIQKTKSIKQAKILTMLLLSIFTLSIPTWAKNTKNVELEDINLDETLSLDTKTLKKLINDNIQFQNGPNKKLSESEIENIALKQFVYYRNNGGLVGARFRKLLNPHLNNGVIYFQSRGIGPLSIREKTKDYSTKIQVDDQGNFSVFLGGNGEYQNKSDVEAVRAGTIIGKKRKDGYYNIYVYQFKYGDGNICVAQHVCDSKGNTVNQGTIRQRFQFDLQKELDKIQYLDGTNKDMIASILAGNDIYDIDYVVKDGIYKIYADKLDKNIEIRFVKTDASTIYGVYIVSFNDNREIKESNNGSEIYAFKYSDESTPKKQRVTLMTKRVVQYDFDEKYPSTQKYTTGTKGKEVSYSQEFTNKTGLFNRKITTNTSKQLKSIYENFMCESVIYKTYTKDNNGKFYQNQQEMF